MVEEYERPAGSARESVEPILAPGDEAADSEQSQLRALRLDCPVIETGDLLLRPPHIEDAADIAELANNYRVASMLSSMPHPYFLADARDFVAMASKAENGECIYAITQAGTGRFMGVCGLHVNPARFELPFIGYWLGEPYWGQGYATQAARAMVDLYFKVTDGEALMISCRIDNHASRRVIEKCGGRYWKRGSEYNKTLGQMQTIDNYRVARADWMASAAA